MFRCVLTLVAAATAFAQSESNFEVGLKTLVLTSDDYSFVLPELILKAYGSDYEVVSVTEEVLVVVDGVEEANRTIVPDAVQLFDSTGAPKYNSIVYSSSNLGYSSLEAWIPSGLSFEQRTMLDNYCSRFGVRRVMLNSQPADVGDPALTAAPSVPWGKLGDANTRVQLRSSAESYRGMLKSDLDMVLGGEHEFAQNWVWISPGVFDAQRPSNTTILLDLDYSDGYSVSTGVGAAVANDVMYFFFAADSYGLSGQTLGHLWFPWVTKGLFVGQRRIILDTQIDDLYLDTMVYNTTLNRQATDDEFEPIFGYRTTGPDINFHAKIRNKMRKTMPTGTNFTIQLAYNGKGYGEFANVPEYSPNANTRLLRRFNQFLWLTHTWNHIDMYCVNSNCADPALPVPTVPAYTVGADGKRTYIEPEYPTSGYTPRDLLHYELDRNNYFANDVLEIDTDAKRAKRYSQSSIVTPRISGLNYTVAIEAMLHAGHFTAVGDNSRIDLEPDNPYHPFMAKAKVGENGVLLSDADREAFESRMMSEYGRKSVMIIPRFSTRVYFDVSTPLQNAMEHNSFYGPDCYGWDQWETPTAGGFKCNAGTFKYPRNLTFDEIMEIEGFEAARNLLSLRADPYMFHQANLRVLTEDGVENSLLNKWISAALRWVRSYTEFPIKTYKMDDLADVYNGRMKRDQCGVEAKVSYKVGQPKGVTLSKAESSEGCVYKVTHTTVDGSAPFVPRGSDISGRSRYGKDITYDVTFSEIAMTKDLKFKTVVAVRD